MIYTVECAFTDPPREEEWNIHYSGEKLDNLLRLPGWLTSQRFRALTPIDAPYFAMHTLRDAGVLGGQYSSVGGGVFGGWENEIANWHRNLFAGIDVAPEVKPDECLVVTADPTATFRFPTLTFQWMDACGLDRSVAMLGLAVVPRVTGESLAADHADALRVYEPIMERKEEGLAEAFAT
jgi:hypothetical protein